MKNENGTSLIILVLLTVVGTVIAFFSYVVISARQYRNNNLEEEVVIPEKKVAVKKQEYSCDLPDLTSISPPEESVKTPAKIDVNEWELYENSEVGIRFRHPKDWKIKGDSYSCNYDDVASGCSYGVGLTNNEEDASEVFYIRADGVSMDHSVPIGFHSFRGFVPDSRGQTAQEFCELENNTLIFCKPDGNKVDVLTNINATNWFFDKYHRNLYFDRPEHKIRGIQFQGYFLSKHYRKLENIYVNSPEERTNCTNEEVSKYKTQLESLMQKMEKNILENRLDQESVDRYAILEQIYKTVENI